MQHQVLTCFLLLSLFLTNIDAQCADYSEVIDLNYPDHFEVAQDFALRAFHIRDGTICLGTILNSDYGVFDFYNSQREKCWINRFDVLYDPEEQILAWVKVNTAGFFNETSSIEIFSPRGEVLSILQPEGDGKCFVFRDAENNKPLAIALWSWKPTETSWFSWFDYYVQNWEVIIVDRERLEEKNISTTFLIWGLLKHSQKHFPDPNQIKYQKTLPEPDVLSS